MEDQEDRLKELRRILQDSLRPDPPRALEAAPTDSPHTPATNLEKRLRAVQTLSIKDKHKEAAHRRRFPPVRELNFEDSPLASPLLSAQNSVVDALEDEVSRYYEDFEELGTIAAGDFGEVYRCQHRLDKQQYAVKRLKLNIATAAAKQQALQEALALAASSFHCDSHHILKYRNMWIERSHLFMAMELCDCSLRTFVERQGRLSTQQLYEVVRDVCKGLRELHAMGTVHLDVKPENILYSFTHRFKLGDLGLARMLTELTGEVPEGDARYLAPEQLQQPSDPTKCDIFSLGATIYECMLGCELPSCGEAWHALRQGRLAFPSGSDPQLVLHISSMLHPNPASRPSAQFLLETAFLSPTQCELKRLHAALDDRPVKRRKLSL